MHLLAKLLKLKDIIISGIPSKSMLKSQSNKKFHFSQYMILQYPRLGLGSYKSI
jgi:hypothetical protein